MSHPTFIQRIRKSIADPDLQIALDGNAFRRTSGRLKAFESLPDWPERRQRAHAVRAEVIEHLETYLEQFITHARANGITLHRAATAAEAAQIVQEIIGPRPGQLIAKSKSMVSEEVELNHALESAGHRVVETDLGEYIVQLRGERPAHILTPAVHLRREQVGQLFHEKLGVPYTEDIPEMVATARRALRQVFLHADIGISGVNFGVAETGTYCLVTNEGNGRMVTTLPPVHIALMGMERLLPTLDDLALLLSLLPRAATGQKLSVYTQLIHAPLPGQARHIVIVDNGRAALRQSPLREALYCIRCGSCLNACPVFREIGGHGYLGADASIAPYPGPIGSVVSPGLLGPNYVQLAQASSLCGACKEACPVDIDLPKLLLRVRAGQMPVKTAQNGEKESESLPEGQALPPGLKLALAAYSRLARHPNLFSASQQIAGLALAPLPPYLRLPAFTGWGQSKDLPKPAARTFRQRWAAGEFDPPPAGDFAPGRQAPSAAPPPPLVAAPAPRLVDQFGAELSALGGHVTRLKAQDVTDWVLAFLQERNVTEVEMWDSLPALDQTRLAQASIRGVRWGDGVQVGITGALCALANTGSLFIPHAPGQPLTASLVPPIHLAIVRAEQVLPNLEAALRLPEVRHLPVAAIVTGPSRTGDIEMALTVGVHGPKEVHVLVVD